MQFSFTFSQIIAPFISDFVRFLATCGQHIFCYLADTHVAAAATLSGVVVQRSAAMLVAAEEGAADETPCLTMFESKEEVERTMLALKIFPDIDKVVEAEQEDPETDEEEYAPQVHSSTLLTF